jgi:hypothetical protein
LGVISRNEDHLLEGRGSPRLAMPESQVVLAQTVGVVHKRHLEGPESVAPETIVHGHLMNDPRSQKVNSTEQGQHQ